MKTTINNFVNILSFIMIWNCCVFAQYNHNNYRKSLIDTSHITDSSIYLKGNQCYLRGSFGFHAAFSGDGGVSYGLGLNYCQTEYIFSGIFEGSVDLSSMLSSPNAYNMTFGLLAGKKLHREKYSESYFLAGLGIEHVVKRGKFINSGFLGNIHETLSYYTIAIPVQCGFDMRVKYLGIGILSSINFNIYRPYCALMLYTKIGKL